MAQTFGGELRRLLQQRHMSLRALARQIPYDVGGLSRFANDQRAPTPKIADRIDQILRADGALSALARQPRSPLSLAGVNGTVLTPDDEDRYTAAAVQPSRLDTTVIHTLTRVLDAQRHLEDAIGAAAIVGPVRTQLEGITRLIADTRGPLRAQLVEVAAQWGQYAGWLTSSTHPARSRGYFTRALEWATEIDERAMIGSVLSWRGYLSEAAGHIGDMIGLSNAARREHRTPASIVYDLHQEARGHAIAGEHMAAYRLLDQAANTIADPSGPAQPWEYYYFTAGFWQLERGWALRILGQRNRRDNQAAIDALTAGLAALPANMQGSEWTGRYVYQLGCAYRQAGERERAREVAVELRRIGVTAGSRLLVAKAAALR